MAHRSLYWRTTHKATYGFTPDVAHLMKFELLEPNITIEDKTQFPESRDIFGYYAGNTPNKGAIDCSWVWTKENGLLLRSVPRYANRHIDTNRCMVQVSGDIKGESSNFEPVKFIYGYEVKDGTDDKIPYISYKYEIDKIHHVNDIIYHKIISRKTFLPPQGKYRKFICAQFKAQADQLEKEIFLVSLGERQDTDIVTYDTIIKGIDTQLQHEYELEDKGKLFSFRDITDNRIIKGTSYSYEVLVYWEDGNSTCEPVSVMRRDDPISLARYTRDNDLMDNTGWNQLHRYVMNTNTTNHLFKATNDKYHRKTVNIKFGINIPRYHKEAMMFDAENGKTNWKDADILELKKSTTSTPSNIPGLLTAHISFLAILRSKYILFMTTNKM